MAVKQLYNAADFLKPPDPIDWVVQDLLAAGHVLLLFGPPGGKKSLAAYDMATSVAVGDPWLDFQTMQGPALIVDEEMGDYWLKKRMGQVLRGHGGDDQTPVYGVSLERFNLNLKKSVAELYGLVQVTQARLVVLDALIDLAPGKDENSADQMNPVLTALRDIATDRQCAILLIHHANKNGGYRGSSAILGNVDLAVSVSSKQGEELVEFESTKLRHTATAKFAGLAHFDPDDDSFRMNPESPATQKSLTKAEQTVLLYVANNEPCTTSDVEANAGVKSARDVLYLLRDRGLIMRADSGTRGTAALWRTVTPFDVAEAPRRT